MSTGLRHINLEFHTDEFCIIREVTSIQMDLFFCIFISVIKNYSGLVFLIFISVNVIIFIIGSLVISGRVKRCMQSA